MAIHSSSDLKVVPGTVSLPETIRLEPKFRTTGEDVRVRIDYELDEGHDVWFKVGERKREKSIRRYADLTPRFYEGSHRTTLVRHGSKPSATSVEIVARVFVGREEKMDPVCAITIGEDRP